MVEEFSKDYWAGVHARGASSLPKIASPAEFSDEHRLYGRYLNARLGTLYEIGCAPGRWLAYFAKYHDMRVAGLEYVAEATELTRLNMSMQQIDADVRCGDFFQPGLPEGQYDVVYSRGFIEHYPDTAGVVGRVVSIARPDGGYVVTTVPNFRGINGWIRKRWVPESYAGHVHLTPQQVQAAHEAAGMATLFCGYCGVPRLILPREVKPDAVAQRRLLNWLAAKFQYVVNGVFKRICVRLGWVPRSRLMSPTIMYIGRRTAHGDRCDGGA